MDTATHISRIIGPLLAVNGVAALLGGKSYRTMANEFLGSRALIYLSGFMTLIIGLGIVSASRPGSPVLLTIIGWLFVIGGAFRTLFPERAMQMGKAMLDKRPSVITVGGIVQLIIGLTLSHAGYGH